MAGRRQADAVAEGGVKPERDRLDVRPASWFHTRPSVWWTRRRKRQARNPGLTDNGDVCNGSQ